ncbi:MAG TPA: amino acid adenylation domain-containing protein [Longimicrobium sp.]|nr:amino acid adenylation domain-containing protein [Longimicrobium sp.]
MQELDKKRAGLSDAKRKLLELRMRGQGPALTEREVIPRAAGDGPDYPLSYMQEQMWFATELAPDQPVYNVPVALLVSATLDVDALSRAFSEVVHRHEGLRTVFRAVDGELRQVVLPPHTVPVHVRDARGEIGDDLEEGVRALVAREGAVLMDLETGPLVRISLLRVSEDRAALVIVIHHIVTDGWAYPLLLSEMWALYAGIVNGHPVELPDPGLRYADYAVWQRGHLKGPALDKLVDFWRGTLEGAPDTEVPGDRPRPARPTHRGAFHHFTVDAETTYALRDFCRREAVTVNMVMSTAFAVLLSRWSGDPDVVFGTLFGNRTRPELANVVGCFLNSLPLRLRLTDDPPFIDAVRRARTAFLEADAHQELPFEKLVELLRIPRDHSRNPAFQVMYFHHTYLTSHKQEVDAGLEVEQVYGSGMASLVDTGVTKYDMTVVTLEHTDHLTGMVEYATDLFDASTIQRFCDHFARLVRMGALGPDRPVSTLPLLSHEERAKLLGDWGSGRSIPVPAAPVHRLVEARAQAAPDAPALRDGDRILSYGELNARANRLARRLRELGVRPETRVALLLDRSAELQACILAVWKAGGAFVPVDPALPAERRRALLEDSGAAVVVTSAARASLVPAHLPSVVADDEAELAGFDASDLDGGAEAGNAAYVIYTSGSTGTPKGVEVEHASLASLCAWQIDFLRITPADRATQVAQASFDASLWEVWPYLAAGASVEVIGDDLRADPAALRDHLAARGITLAFAPTPLVEPLLGLDWPAETKLRALLTGGDRLHRRPQAGLPFALINGYGPTETTVAATVHQVAPEGEVNPPIGRPVGNLTAYVLDASGYLVPAGVPGELYVGGAGVARGYLGRSALTAERFLPDPFSTVPGARMYRTGDRVRWLADGELEYLGRLDAQVKLRGFRMEPGEVEAVLLRHPGVAVAAAAVREDAAGQPRLGAWIVPAEGAAVDAAEMRAWLRDRLPDFMVPTSFAFLDALPLTASGKVDRAALPAPEVPTATAEFEAPEGMVQETLARIWAEVLGRDRVGAHDNFFELGGDSILAIGVIVRAAREGIRVTPRQMFQHPTVAELAASAGATAAVRAEQGTVTGEAPLTPVQRWFFAEEIPQRGHWNMAVLLQSAAPLDPAALEGAVEAVLTHHDALRGRFEPAAGGWRHWIAAPGDPVPFERADLSSLSPTEAEAEASARAAAAQASLDLGAGPLFRVLLLDFGAGRPARLLLAAHHLVMDAVSWGPIVEDLETAYRAISAGEDPRLPPKTSAFRDWAIRLEEHARSEKLRAEANYWLDAIPSRVPPVPVDAPDAPDTEAGTAAAFAELDEAETRALLEEVPPVYGTQANDALLAALAAAYREWSGHGTLLVDVEGHGREDLFDDMDVSRTVGWFTTQFPVRLEDRGAPGETLKGVKETLRAVPERGIGYGLLRWMGGAEVSAALGALPEARISFNYLGQAGAGGGAASDRLLAPAAGDVGPLRAPDSPRRHRIAVDGAITGGRLRMGFFHGREAYRPETVERLAAAYEAALRALIDHCRAPEAGGFTPSDFPEAGLDQSALDALLDQLGG